MKVLIINKKDGSIVFSNACHAMIGGHTLSDEECHELAWKAALDDEYVKPDTEDEYRFEIEK